MPRPPATPPSGARVWPLDGGRATTMDAIVSGLAGIRSAVPRAAALPANLDLVAAEWPETAEIIATTRLLVELLLQEMAAGDAQPSPFASGENAALGDLRHAVDALTTRVARAFWKDALGDAAAIIREVGLERHDLDCQLASDPSGAHAIVSAPVPPATAHAWLLDRLFQRAEMFVLTDELLTCERMASAWYFSTWSVGGRSMDPEGMDFTRRVREQEWSLVERETVTFDESVMAALVRDERFAGIPPRQQRLARALAASILDIFVVEAVHGDRMTLRSVRGGRAHQVHEHNPDARARPGYFVIGRLIPLEKDVWLRSPGTVSFAPRRPDEAAVLADALQKASSALPLPIAIEALISAVVLGAKPPISHKPAPSAREARELVEFMTDALAELGLRDEVAPDDVPDELGARMPPPSSGAHYYRFSVDEPLAEWMAALSAQAERRGSSGRSGAARSSGHSKGQGAKKGRKKRKR